MTAPRLILPLVLVLAACEHTTPFSPGRYTPSGPFATGNPLRLTYSTGVDAWPTWLPDGSAILYTQERLDQADRDECLTTLPAGGGVTTRTICAASDPAGDSLNVYQSPAVSADGRLAYVRLSTLAFAGRGVPDYAQLVLAAYATPLAAAVLEPLSYFSPAGRSVDLVRDIRFIGATTLVYLAEQATYTCANFGCTAIDTTVAGLDVERLDFAAAPPVLSVVPATDSATSLAAGAADTIYFTRAGSGQVHRRILSTGADTVLADFGTAATDLSQSGSRLAVILGSTLRVVDWSTGFDQSYAVAGTDIHHPALSPDGHRLVAELAPVDSATYRETAPTDLWLWTLP